MSGVVFRMKRLLLMEHRGIRTMAIWDLGLSFPVQQNANFLAFSRDFGCEGFLHSGGVTYL